MTEPKDLLVIVEQLRRSNRRWKAVALAACRLVAACGAIRRDEGRGRAHAG